MRGIQRLRADAEHLREFGDQFIAARRTLVDGGAAACQRFGIRPAAGITAHPALRLRKQIIDPVGWDCCVR